MMEIVQLSVFQMKYMMISNNANVQLHLFLIQHHKVALVNILLQVYKYICTMNTGIGLTLSVWSKLNVHLMDYIITILIILVIVTKVNTITII